MPVEDPGTLTGLVPANFPSGWLFFFRMPPLKVGNLRLDIEQTSSFWIGTNYEFKTPCPLETGNSIVKKMTVGIN